MGQKKHTDTDSASRPRRTPDGKAWGGNLSRQPEPGYSCGQQPDAVHPQRHPWAATLDRRPERKEAASSGRSGKVEGTHAVRPAGGLLQPPQRAAQRLVWQGKMCIRDRNVTAAKKIH